MNKVKEYRKKKEKTQEQLAREAQISRTYLNKVENNKVEVGLSVAHRISLALEESIENLFFA